MLVAKRDPFHPGANNVSLPKAPRMARALSALQIVGTLLAVPVGLGSAYSIYRANFSVEITCQNLRANIVAMLDRNVDPNARHMLVRRDVEAFEQACREFDPDATAAFRTLLAVDKKVPVGSAPVVVAAPSKSDAVVKSEAKLEPKNDSKTEAKTETVIRKIETRPALAAKQPVPTVVEAKPTQRDLATSDAAWLSAVREALVKNEPDPSHKRTLAPAAVASMPPFAAPQPVAPPSLEKRSLGELRTPAPQPVLSAAPVSLAAPAADAAPALPAPIANVIAPAIDDGHPVPPEAIPDAVPAFAEKPASRSRIGALIAKIPFVGSALER